MKIETHLDWNDFNSLADYLNRVAINTSEGTYDQKMAAKYSKLFCDLSSNEDQAIVIVQEHDEIKLRLEEDIG